MRLWIVTALWLATLTAFAQGPGENYQEAENYYRDAVQSANGLTPDQQRDAVSGLPTADQAAGLSYAGTQDQQEVLRYYDPDGISRQIAAKSPNTYQDPTRNDPVPQLETVNQQNADDVARSGDPALAQDTRDWSMARMQDNGKGAWIGAAQHEETGLDQAGDIQGRWNAMDNTKHDAGYGCTAPNCAVGPNQ